MMDFDVHGTNQDFHDMDVHEQMMDFRGMLFFVLGRSRAGGPESRPAGSGS